MQRNTEDISRPQLQDRAQQPVAPDFDSVRQRLGDLAQAAFPQWSDHGTPSLGNVLLDLYAYVADVLGHYIQCQGREARLATATQRDNVVAISHMLGYRPTGATAAQAEVIFELRRPHDRDVVVPEGYEIGTLGAGDTGRFRLLQSVTIEAGTLRATGIAEASTARQEVTDASGTANFVWTLAAADYLDGSAAVSDAAGECWHEVPHLLKSGGAERHFSVSHGRGHKPVLQFGNGTSGRVPAGMLKVTYRTGGGTASNVAARAISLAIQPIYDTARTPVEVQAYNPASATGGQDHESLDSIRRKAPLSCRVAGLTVTREDFEINAYRVPQVARALMLTSDQCPGIQENTGRLYIVPDGGGPLTQAMQEAVLRMVTKEYPCMLTFRVMPETAIYLPIHIAAHIELTEDAPSAQHVRSLVDTALHRMFAITIDGKPNGRVNFGFYSRSKGALNGEVAWSDVVTTIASVPGVRKLNGLTLNGQACDVALDAFHFPRISTVDVAVGVPNA